MHFPDVSGKILDLSMLAAGQGEEASIQAAVLAESEEKRLLTLIKIPNSVVDEGTCNLAYNTAILGQQNTNYAALNLYHLQQVVL